MNKKNWHKKYGAVKKNIPWQPGFCIHTINEEDEFSGARISRQCKNRNGHGKDKSFCAVHK